MSMKGPFPLMPMDDAALMTRAETIMRREEAAKMKWPLQLCGPGPLERGESLLLYGGAPGGGMVSESGFDIAARILSAQRRQNHHIACAEQVTGGAERCDCGTDYENLVRHRYSCRHPHWRETYNGVECPDCGKAW